MKFFPFILLASLSFSAYSQSNVNKFTEPTSQVIIDISIGWKKDSLGKDGYRSKVFERVRYSKIDNISNNDLFKALGTPHHTSRFYSGNTNKNYVGYRYYVYCINDYPKEKFFMGSYIEFVFDETETKFIKISDGDYCG